MKKQTIQEQAIRKALRFERDYLKVIRQNNGNTCPLDPKWTAENQVGFIKGLRYSLDIFDDPQAHLD